MHPIATVLLPLLSATASATDDRPVRCPERQAYAGRPLHPAVSAAPSAVPERALDPATTARLDATLTTIRAKTGAPAVTAAVGVEGAGLWSAGDAAPLFWASAGKTFTAVVILQLVQEGKLSLDDPVSRWIRDVPNGDVATVRDLLAHTAGLFSANEDAKARAHPQYRGPAEALAVARRHGAMFCPGAGWRYSNTGYDLLGEIVRIVDRPPVDRAITARIVVPLDLTTLRALPPGAVPLGWLRPRRRRKSRSIPAGRERQVRSSAARPTWCGSGPRCSTGA